jgi:signal transduction histidine kinase
MNNIESDTYRIRPAGRHILTIGSELIKDRYAAVVELVKNAFDADSPEVNIKFSAFEKKVAEKTAQFIKIVIADKGHGMSRNDVVKKWLVPSTDDKLERKISPKRRKLQGRKGIGRYAASILGDDLLLETVNERNEFTTIYVEWEAFENSEYLEDVDVLVETVKTNKSQGTTLTIIGGKEHLEQWTENEINKLIFELKKLLSPTFIYKESESGYKTGDNKEHFDIKLEFKEFPVEPYRDFSETIEPYPLLELYDYRIVGKVSKNGKTQLIYHNNRIPNSKEEKIEFTINLTSRKDIDMDYCGEVKLDFRVYDREPDAIDNLIKKGLKNPITKKPVSISDVKSLLNSYNGIGVYRNGFRIRPLGDPGYDWLELDKARVLKPASRIGSNQVIGFIQIQSEEDSILLEKSARDGLKENKQYNGLKEIGKQVLQRLQDKRYLYRKKAGLGREVAKLEKKILKLFEYEDLKKEVKEKLDAFGVKKDDQDIIIDLIKKKESEQNKTVEELRNAIAVYQGQATLGKIVNVILHEGRSPLSVIKNETDTIMEWSKRLTEHYNIPLLERIAATLEKIGEHSKVFVDLFKRLDPLASKKRGRKKEFRLIGVIEDSFQIFKNELKSFKIDFHINCKKEIKIHGWKEDFFTIFTNLIDNSIYWLNTVTKINKKIKVDVYVEGEEVIIDFVDNGPGIEKELIDSKIIFDPEFSRKTEGGAGLGLAISGEAITRNNGELEAHYFENGAFLRITVKEGDMR